MVLEEIGKWFHAVVVLADIVLVDGMNLVYKFPDLAFLVGDRRVPDAQVGLLAILQDYYSERDRMQLQVFFDGKKSFVDDVYSEDVGSIRVHYSHDQTADDLIMGYLRLCPKPSDCLVVTSDKEILSFARRLGARRVTSEQFYSQWKEVRENSNSEKIESQKESILSEQDLDFWEQEFNK